MTEESTPSSKSIENEVYNDPILKSGSSTHIKFVKLRHTWTIHNFSFCGEKNGEKLVSPIFSVKNNQWNDKSEWRLELYPKGDDQDSSEFVSVFINLNTSNLKKIQTKYKLGFVDVSGADTNVHDNSAKFDIDRSTSGYSEFVLQDFLLNQENKILMNDKLTVFCEITTRVVIENNSQALPTSKCNLSKVLHVNKYNDSEYDYPIFKSTSYTLIKIVKFRHTWTVHNLGRSWEESGETLTSPPFSAGQNQWNDKSEWCLRIYPKGINMESSEYVSLYLVLHTYLGSELQAKLKLGIVNADGKVIRESLESSHLFVRKGIAIGWPTFIKWNDLYTQENKFAVDDKLNIFCEIVITLGSDNTSKILNPTQSELPKDFDFLLGNSELSDITLSAGGKEFPAHKVFLAARSPVFRAMFKHDMVESRENRVEITDLEEEGLYEMLRYMYTGEIYNLKEMAPRLLGIAEKYAIDGLKIACEEALLESLSVENAAETFVLSDTFRATELKNRVKKFIVDHAEKVGKTPGFESMVRTHPHLALEAFCALSNPSIVC